MVPSHIPDESGPSRRTLLSSLAVAATALTAGCSGLTGEDATPTERIGEQQPLSVGVSGGSCLPDPDDLQTETGWVYTAAHGERDDVSFDVQVGHDHTTEASVSLTSAGNNDFDLTFSAAPTETDRRKSEPDSDCRFGTRFTGGGSLPSEFERLRVVAGDETVLTVEPRGTMPVLYRLPTPIQL